MIMKWKDRKIRAGGHGSYAVSLPKALVESLRSRIVSIQPLPGGEGVLLKCSAIEPAKILKVIKDGNK